MLGKLKDVASENEYMERDYTRDRICEYELNMYIYSTNAEGVKCASFDRVERLIG